MAKLFADRLQILETKLENIHDNVSLETRLTECEHKLNEMTTKLNETNAKITQIINEITPLITSHANALNALLGNSHITNNKLDKN